MECCLCGDSVQNVNLHRTKKFGQLDAGWMCTSCLKRTEPELYRIKFRLDGQTYLHLRTALSK
jgi:hypothetical protein